MLQLLENGKVKNIKQKNLSKIKDGYIIIDISTPYLSNIYTIVKANKIRHDLNQSKVTIDIGINNNECGIDLLTIHSEQLINDYSGYYSIYPLQCLMETISDTLHVLDFYIDEPYIKNFTLENKNHIISLMDEKVIKSLELKTHVSKLDCVQYIVFEGNKWEGYNDEFELPVAFDYILIKYPALESVHILSHMEFEIMSSICDFTINIYTVEESDNKIGYFDDSFSSVEGILLMCLCVPDIIRILSIMYKTVKIEILFMHNGNQYNKFFTIKYGESINLFNMLIVTILGGNDIEKNTR